MELTTNRRGLVVVLMKGVFVAVNNLGVRPSTIFPRHDLGFYKQRQGAVLKFLNPFAAVYTRCSSSYLFCSP
jgi:hypothetical protein